MRDGRFRSSGVGSYAIVILNPYVSQLVSVMVLRRRWGEFVPAFFAGLVDGFLVFKDAVAQIVLARALPDSLHQHQDFGALPFGFESNFAIGTMEVQSGSTLDLVNDVANGPGGSGNCNEAVYVDTLILRTGSVLRPTGGNLYYRNIVGDGTIETDFVCGGAIQVVMDYGDCDLDLRDVGAFMVCFGMNDTDPGWASCL